MRELMYALEVKNLTKTFDKLVAVDNASFEVPEGSIFGLIGRNGAGKTTTIRMMMGIYLPDSGEVSLRGVKVGQEFKNQVGYLPEERGLYKKMKIGEQAMYLAQLKGLSKAEAMQKIKFWFKKLEMETWWNKKVEDLSKGMSQKLQFVTTVLHEPKLIILDEPFSGLDPLNANLIKEEIYGLAKRGSTVIFSTHRMEQVEEICDHIVLVNLGKKILDGTVHNIKQQFKENKFSIKLNELPGTLSAPAFNIVNVNDNELVLQINEGFKSNDILTHFLNNQCTIESFHEILPTLNEIFISQVEGTHATARAFQKIDN